MHAMISIHSHLLEGMRKLILLTALCQLASAHSLWPRDTFGYDIFLGAEGKDCLNRIEKIPTFNLDTSFTPEDERKVLLDIYESTHGNGWFNHTGWKSAAKGTSHCSWYGITCHDNTSYIKAVVLAYNNLDGSLPSNLWKIRNLFSLCTPGNPSLQGRIGDFLFGNMSKLLVLKFNEASISGDIPETIVQLTRFTGKTEPFTDFTKFL